MWLLEANIRRRIETAENDGFVPSADQQLRIDAVGVDTSRVVTVAGDTAEIKIHGVLSNKFSYMAYLFGGGNTTYPEIISALAEADADASVKEIILNINSPGGTVEGLFDTLTAINTTNKPVIAKIDNQAASAAFSIASQADKLIATNPAASFGSIGVVIGAYISNNEITITNTESPDKRPDLSTEEGKAVVRQHLDDIHELFAKSIASGRDTTVEKVNADFGKGAMFLADEALKRGMIDSIADSTTAISGIEPEASNMDLKTLKADHADVYQAAVNEGIIQGVEQGTAKERDRVGAHLTAGELSGDMKTAVAAAIDGTEMTMTLQTQYMMSAANKGSIDSASDDANDANDALDDTDKGSTEDKEKTVGANILKLAASIGGVELEA